jgi:hypothetical protein
MLDLVEHPYSVRIADVHVGRFSNALTAIRTAYWHRNYAAAMANGYVPQQRADKLIAVVTGPDVHLRGSQIDAYFTKQGDLKKELTDLLKPKGAV